MAFWARMKSVFGCDELSKNRDIWRMLMAEFVGPLFLVLIGCASCVEGWNDQYSPHIVQVALSFGVTIATMAQVRHSKTQPSLSMSGYEVKTCRNKHLALSRWLKNATKHFLLSLKSCTLCLRVRSRCQDEPTWCFLITKDLGEFIHFGFNLSSRPDELSSGGLAASLLIYSEFKNKRGERTLKTITLKERKTTIELQGVFQVRKRTCSALYVATGHYNCIR